MSSRRRLDEQLLGERVADLDARAASTDRRRRTWRWRGPTRRRCRRGRSCEPNRTTRLPGPGRRGAREVRPRSEADRHHVDQRVALVRGVEDELAADRRHADAVAVAADAAHDAVHEVARPRRRAGRRSGARRGRAIGRAPIVKMSRRMPPTPVAAPWYGSTALGWLCDSILNATASPSPIADDAGVLARPGDHVVAAGRQRRAGAAASSCTSSARST